MAITPPLMSERDEPYAPSWRDCTYAAAMMAAYKAGFRAFPLGYTAAEREALERSDDRPDETGASVLDIDLAMRRRYGFTLKPVAVPLATVLAGPATTGLLVSGRNDLLPSHLRRWSPKFMGGHAVYVQPVGDKARVRWMDPLATWGFPGEIVAVSTVLAWARPYGPGMARFAREGMAAVVPPPAGVVLKYGGYVGYRGTWRVLADGSRFRSKPYLTAPIVATVNRGYRWSNAQTTDRGTNVNGSSRWLGNAAGDRWMHVSLVDKV